MNFYLLSKSKKKETKISRNHINYKENEFYKYIESMPNIKNNIKNKINSTERLYKNEKKNEKGD